MRGSRVELDGLVFRRAVPDHQIIDRAQEEGELFPPLTIELHHSYSLISV